MIQETNKINLFQEMYGIDCQTWKDKYNQNNCIKFETESIKSSLCVYSDGLFSVIGDRAVTEENNTDVLHSKFVHHFLRVTQKLIMCFIDEASHIYIKMPM